MRGKRMEEVAETPQKMGCYSKRQSARMWGCLGGVWGGEKRRGGGGGGGACGACGQSGVRPFRSVC